MLFIKLFKEVSGLKVFVNTKEQFKEAKYVNKLLSPLSKLKKSLPNDSYL